MIWSNIIWSPSFLHYYLREEVSSSFCLPDFLLLVLKRKWLFSVTSLIRFLVIFCPLNSIVETPFFAFLRYLLLGYVSRYGEMVSFTWHDGHPLGDGKRIVATARRPYIGIWCTLPSPGWLLSPPLNAEAFLTLDSHVFYSWSSSNNDPMMVIIILSGRNIGWWWGWSFIAITNGLLKQKTCRYYRLTFNKWSQWPRTRSDQERSNCSNIICYYRRFLFTERFLPLDAPSSCHTDWNRLSVPRLDPSIASSSSYLILCSCSCVSLSISHLFHVKPAGPWDSQCVTWMYKEISARRAGCPFRQPQNKNPSRWVESQVRPLLLLPSIPKL